MIKSSTTAAGYSLDAAWSAPTVLSAHRAIAELPQHLVRKLQGTAVVVDDQNRPGRGRRDPASLQRFQKIAPGQWFGQDVGNLKSGYDSLVRQQGRDDDGSFSVEPALAQLFQYGPAAHVRQHDVKSDGVESLLPAAH